MPKPKAQPKDTAAAAAGQLIQLPDLPSTIEITADWLTSRQSLLDATSTISEIASRADYDAAGEALKKLTKTSNAMEAFRKQYSEPFLEAQRKIKSAADVAREPLESEKGRLQRLMTRYADEEERKARAEAQRIEREQREAAERRIAEDQERREAAELLGLEAPPEPAAPVVEPAAAPVVRAPVSADVKRTKVIEFVITNPDDVPPSMMTIDESKIREYARIHKERIMAALTEDPNAGPSFLMGITFKIESRISSR